MARKLVVEIVGDTRQLEKAFGRVEKQSNKFGRALKVGAGAALGGLALAARAGFQELGDAQKAAAQTAAVLKSTGGAANVTAKQIDELANSLLNVSGVDDEVIKQGENMLLTFRNIHNEVGKGNDIFNQATKATLDLSVAMGKDMQSSAILVGKALNDPVRGLTALRRVGVSFTKAQEDQIKALVKTGHTMEAQKIILRELTAEFGGSAKAAGDTLPGQLSKAREQFRNLAAQLTVALLPAFEALTKIMLQVAGFLTRHKTLAKLLVVGLGALAVAILTVNTAWKAYTAVTRAAALANIAFGRSAAGMTRGIGSARLALIGKAGLVAAVGVASYEITKMILKVTGLDTKLRSLGGRLFDLTHGGGPNLGGLGAGAHAGAFLRHQAARLEAGGMTAAQAAARIAATHPGVRRSDIDVYAGVAAGGVVVNGGLHLHGVQNVKQLEDELHKRAKARPHVRRGAR
jgi:hypothetical protein